MYSPSVLRTKREYASREVRGAMMRTSMSSAAWGRSVSHSVRAKRMPAIEWCRAYSARAGLAVSTQQSVTPGSSRIGGDENGFLYRRGLRLRQLVPEQDAEEHEQGREVERRPVDGGEIGDPRGDVGEREHHAQEGQARGHDC